MKEIIFLLEYGTYPIWTRLDEDDVSAPFLPDEREKDERLKTKLDELQNLYESLFINSPVEFRYVGPKTKEEQDYANNLVEEIRNYATKNIPLGYVFEDKVSHNPF